MRKKENIEIVDIQGRGRKRSPDSFLNILDSLEKPGDMKFVPFSKMTRSNASAQIGPYSERTGRKFATVRGMRTVGTTPNSIEDTEEGFWVVLK